MEVKEIVEAFIRHKGLHRVVGDDTDLTPLYPLVVMDLALQLFNKYIRPIECHHEMKKLKMQWIKCYNQFNMDYFRAFNQEQTDYMCDLMDKFEEYVEHDITIAFIQFTNVVNHEESIERQKVLAAGMLIGVLCQCAGIFWGFVYKSRFGGEVVNVNIRGCERYMHKWTELYHGRNSPYINPNDNKELCRAVDILCKKQVYFLAEYNNGKS